jgi:thiamine biosynthesis lipoprotein
MTVARRSWPIWSTTVEVLVTDPALLEPACAIADLRIGLVGDACDRFRPDSELSRLTDRAEGGVRVSPVLADLVAVALDAAAATGGMVDPTLGRPLRTAGDDRDLRPVQGDRAPVRAIVASPARWRSVRLDGDLLIVPDGVELDLGTTAMARTADAIAATVAGTLRCGVLVNLGGDIATRGQAPEGGWQVTVQDPPADPGCQVALPGSWALATSSTRHRRWWADGDRPHHMIDPRTGTPAVPVWRSVSVAADSAVRANTLATAAVVDGARALHRLCASRFPARLVDAAGGVCHLNGWPDEERRAA